MFSITKAFLLLIVVIFTLGAHSQVYHYSLQEVQMMSGGMEKPIIDFRGKNVELILDLSKNTLSIPKVNNKTYNIRGLNLLGEDEDAFIYQGFSSENGKNDWKFNHYVNKKDNWSIFQIESLNEAGTSISYVCILSDTTIETKVSKASGSGFFISVDGMIATNSHLVQGSKEIEITFTNETGSNKYKAIVFSNNKYTDVAILKIVDNKFKSLKALPYGIETNAEVGEKVFTIGFPLNTVMGDNYKVTDGIISSTTGIGDDKKYFQISTPIQPGNSGGPLFNQDGNVVGITTATLNSKALNIQTQNVNYAIKAIYLLSNIDKVQLKPKTTLAHKPMFEQIKILKNYVCLIRVEY